MQLIYIVQKIFSYLEKHHETRVVFLDISKVFDKVWHKGLLAKLESVVIQGSLYNWFKTYLTDRYQRVNSGWRKIEAGVPQGSVLDPLLFLIYINDLPQGILSECFLFADDSFLLEKVTSPIDSAQKLNCDLNSISSWAKQWLVTMNATKTKSMIISTKKVKPLHPQLFLSNKAAEEVTSHDHIFRFNINQQPLMETAHSENTPESF